MTAKAPVPHTTLITIDGKSYEVNCPQDQVEALHEAADQLNKTIKDFRKSHGNAKPLEHLAVITALNLTHEKLEQEKLIDQLLHKVNVCLS